MATYTVTAINIGSFHLGEADKVLTVFSAERGLIKTVAKGARKPGTKMAGRADLLNINKLFLAHGRTFEIITQSESVESYPGLRKDLARLAFALYYAELTQQFGTGLEQESLAYFDLLSSALCLQASGQGDPPWLSLVFELKLLDMLGYRPELTYCVGCREVLGDYNLAAFNREHGGVYCKQCALGERRLMASEASSGRMSSAGEDSAFITPLVWKSLVLALDSDLTQNPRAQMPLPLSQSVGAARRLIQGYIEHRAGRKMKSLDLLEQLKIP